MPGDAFPERRLGLTLVMRIVTIRNVSSSSPADDRRARTDGPDLARPQGARPPSPRTDSRTLLGEKGELVIEHDGREYRLRITQNGKLILTA